MIQKSSIISKTDVMPSDVEAITNGISNLHIAENSSQSRRGRQINGPNSTATIDHAAANRTTADQASKLLKHEKFTVDKSTYADAKIKAVFYPKFDNDKSHQDRVRIKMIDKVSKGEAILEVSLKHSGSLFMYAGHESGAYSKNDFGNIYTAVGVFVLGRTFRQAWGSEASKKQAEFNEFLERQHMNISMELVTAVLDDHGQRPREDYVVVTAVTEVGNGKPKFYSTPEIIAFCRKWRLPTNHVWLFSTRKSVTTFFATYDQLREEGTATSVCRVLDEVADISVPGSVDHVKFQGEILEGLVARIVSHESTKEIDLVLKDYPSPIAEVHQDLGPGLREIFAANRSDEKQQIKALLQNTGTSFCPNGMDWIGIEAADLLAKNGDPLVSKFLQAENGHHLVSKFLQANPSDYSTTKLKEIVSLIREKLSKDVDFKPSGKKVVDFKHKINSISSENLNFKMVIHVRDDSAFLKYQKEMRDKRDLWPLYRGFFVDINLFKASKERVAEIAKICNDIGNSHKGSDETSTESGLEDEDANLMIKLKFLKYKLRTFLIRNGLSHLIKDDGRAAYKDYYERQMDTWKISKEKKTRLTEMLEEWAEYITRNTNRIQLPSSNYLSEAEPFLEQYAKRSPENQALIGYAGDLVRTEDFLASVQGGRDKEGDIESEKVLEPCSPSHEAVQKKEGLIVFFPGIPGCAKSVLCDAIKNALEGLEDDRPICSLMGDKIEGTYWKKVADKLREKPCSILLADKNAPNVDVWEQIGKMSRETKASAVPIVPVSEGTESNPFSLDALAVFMHRVLNRVNHPGNLEKSTPNVGFVLLMFYDLYDGKNRAEFESNLIELFGSLVKMPLLKSERTPLPDSVKTVLEEGIRLYRLHTTRHGGLDKGERDAWETQLKDVLSGNAEYLTSIQVPFDVVVDTVLEQLKIIMKFGTIVYAAIDVPLVDVHNLLSNISENELKVKLFLENKDLENSLKKAHITLAHKRSHGVTALAHYGPFLNQKVPVDVTALIISDQLAAFETHPGSIDGHKINSKNKWAHLTLWTAEGIPPREANTLPDLVSLGKATRVEINPPFRVSGVLQFH